MGALPVHAFDDDDDDDVVIRGVYRFGPAPVMLDGRVYRSFDPVWVQPAPLPQAPIQAAPLPQGRVVTPAPAPAPAPATSGPIRQADGTLIWQGQVYVPQQQPGVAPEQGRSQRNGDRVYHEENGERLAPRRSDRAEDRREMRRTYRAEEHRDDARRTPLREDYDEFRREPVRDSAEDAADDRGEYRARPNDRDDRARGSERERVRERDRNADVERDVDVDTDTFIEDEVTPRTGEAREDRKSDRTPPPLPAPPQR
jgi:hypothetical protein